MSAPNLPPGGEKLPREDNLPPAGGNLPREDNLPPVGRNPLREANPTPRASASLSPRESERTNDLPPAGEKLPPEDNLASSASISTAVSPSGSVPLREGERLDDLQHSGFKLIQRADAFRFGTDSVLLADFAAPKPRDRAVDLGAGTGAIATLMAAHCPGLTVDLVELQPEIADMARRSAALNGLTDRLRVHAMDMREAWRALGAERFTLAVCNPPYGRDGGGLLSRSETVRLARHEGGLAPDDVARSAGKLLCAGGKLCVVYPAFRALEMMDAMQAHRLAPKRIRTVHGVAGRAPRFVLIDAVKDGRPGLHWLAPLNLREPDGAFSAEWRRIYRVADAGGHTEREF